MGAPRAIEPEEIAAGRLQLRPPHEGEAADTLAMLLDPDVVQWNPVPGVHDEDAARDWCRRAGDWTSGTHATFSVLDATTARLLGHVSLHHVDRDAATADMGYRVAPWARGEGVATTAVAAVTRWALAALDIRCIQLFHTVANTASCRVATSCGYVYERTLEQSYVGSDGSRHDEHLHVVRTAAAPR
jgi:RimJ/RimL family protein N-acetyltransferase